MTFVVDWECFEEPHQRSVVNAADVLHFDTRRNYSLCSSYLTLPKDIAIAQVATSFLFQKTINLFMDHLPLRTDR